MTLGSGRSPGEGNGYPPTLVFLPGEFQGQRSLVGYSSWSYKESDMTEQLTVSISKSNGKSLYGFNQRRLTILKHLPGYSGEKVINRLNMLLQNT